MMTPIEFLKKFHEDRPWILTAITPDQKAIETRAFTDAGEAEGWVAQYEGKRNLYFSVNDLLVIENKKASKDNISFARWLHVDIDVKSGDLLEGLAKIKQAVTKQLPPGLPKPTCIIYSGGGYQAFWRLQEPVPIQGNKEAWLDFERYNIQLRLLFDGSDHCHNVDRIMRLPGTLNIPGAKKTAMGRVPIKASIHDFNDQDYPLSVFAQAADVGATGEADDIKIGNVPRLNSIDDLDRWKVPLRVKVICVQGREPDEIKDKDDSRSAWLFDAVCNLVRYEVPDEVIFSIITDPDFKISESVRSASNPEKYALKQIRSAREVAISPELYELNQKFAVIGNLGGKCRVVEEVYDPVLRKEILVKSSFEDFRNRFMNRKIAVESGDKVRLMPLGKWWLEHERRRYFDRLVFAPGKEMDNVYNLWRGYGCNAIPGSRHHNFLGHVRDVICSGVQQHYNYLVAWMARAVQRPDLTGSTAVVLRGRPGTGKSFFVKHYGRLFGRHFLPITNAAHLIGNFNSHLRDVVLVFGDEAFYAGDHKHEGILKTLITEETFMVEAKGVDAEVCPNYTHLILASNSTWVVPAREADRRFFILDVAEHRERDGKYFATLQIELEAGGYENLLHYLLNYDISKFNIQDIPETDALEQQKRLTLLPHEEWWLHSLQEGILGQETWTEKPIPWQHVWNSFLLHCQHVPGYRLVNRQALASYFKRVCPNGYPKSVRRRMNGDVTVMKVFPNLHDCRVAWDRHYRTVTNWEIPDDIEDAEDGKLPF